MIRSIEPSVLSGSYSAPPSKSDSHRAIIAAALADGISFIAPLAASEDISATIAAVKALDADVTFTQNRASVFGISGSPSGHSLIYCNESGSTLRFLIPIIAAFGVEAVLTGSGKLPERPLSCYHTLLPSKGVSLYRMENAELPLKINGKLRPGRFDIAGNVSSQFITGLLFALPLLEGDSEIALTSPLESKPYVDMTLDTLSRFGVSMEECEQGYRVPGKQTYQPCSYTVEGDFSNAAFFAAAALQSDEGITLVGLNFESRQGDSAILTLIERFGGRVTHGNGRVTIAKGELRGIEIDAAQIPDLVPILSVIGVFAQGTTRIYNAHRLKLKESDRLASMTQALRALGADVQSDDDSMTINGGKRLHGGVVPACNDHRIAMSAAVAALYSDGEVLINGAECVGKSYPNFFEDFNRLGGKSYVRME